MGPPEPDATRQRAPLQRRACVIHCDPERQKEAALLRHEHAPSGHGVVSTLVAGVHPPGVQVINKLGL